MLACLSLYKQLVSAEVTGVGCHQHRLNLFFWSNYRLVCLDLAGNYLQMCFQAGAGEEDVLTDRS